MSDRDNQSNRRNVEHINEVPIFVRPEKQHVDLFTDSDGGRAVQEPSSAPILPMIIGIILLVAIVAGATFGIASLSSKKGDDFELKPGMNYYLELVNFKEPNSFEKAKKMLDEFANNGETMVHLVDKKKDEVRVGVTVIIGFFQVGDEQKLKEKLDFYKVQFPSLVRKSRPIKDK